MNKSKPSKQFNLLKTFKKLKKGENRSHPIIFSFFISLIILFLLSLGGYFSLQKVYQDKVYPNVFLGNHNLGGLRREDVKKLIKPILNKFEEDGLSFVGQSPIGKKEINFQPTLFAIFDPDLSRQLVTFDLEATIDRAFSLGRLSPKNQAIQSLTPNLTSEFLTKFKEILELLSRGKKIEMKFQISEPDIKEILENKFKSLEKPARDANLKISPDGQVEIISQEEGFIFDYQKAIEDLKNDLNNISFQPIYLSLKPDQPKIKKGEIEGMVEIAQKILNSAPIRLKFKDRVWLVNRSLLSQWLISIKDSSGSVGLGLDQNKISDYLKFLAKEIEVEVQEAKFKMVDNRVTEFQTGRPGQKINFEETTRLISQKILNQGQEVDLMVETIEPKSAIENLNDLGIKELIGRGVSNFAGSPQNRRRNIAVGSKKLNGLLIKPDEEFSLVKAIGQVNEETGFLPELVIKGDRTIPEYGGGLCQIGTTTFRVALDAGLPITARTAHSYRVVYYEPAGMDATIYNPQPDFKFINDTGHYILFQTKIEKDNLIFEFYGTKDGREVKISPPKIFNVIRPGPPKYIETEELKPDEKKMVERSHPGADAEFSRIVTYSDGQVKKEVWKSHYKPWPEVWLVGVETQNAVESPQIENKTSPEPTPTASP